MDLSPLSITIDELQENFEAVCEASFKMTQQYKALKALFKKVTLEKEALETKVATLENEVASL